MAETKNITLADDEKLTLKMQTFQMVGVDDYNALQNIPKINDVEVIGNKALSDYDIESASEAKKEFDNLNGKIETHVSDADIHVSSADRSKWNAGTTDIGDPFEYLEAKYPDGGAGLHNSIYRGKNLGTAPTDAQYDSIKSGKFTGIWLGDYWSNGGRIYRNGGANYFGQSGDDDNSVPANHILIIPDSVVLSVDSQTTKYMQDTDTIPGTGYIGTKMWTDTLPNSALPIFSNIFGSHILSHREMLCNGASDGVATSWAWTDVKINIPNQAMVYGHTPWKQGVYGDGYQTGNRKTLLPLFAVRPDLVHTRSGAYWLSDFTSSTHFAAVNRRGFADHCEASGPWYGVRPYVIID